MRLVGDGGDEHEVRVVVADTDSGQLSGRRNHEIDSTHLAVSALVGKVLPHIERSLPHRPRDIDLRELGQTSA